MHNVQVVRIMVPLVVLMQAGPALAAPKHLALKEEQAINAGLAKPPEGLDRSTPNRAWSAMLRYCTAGKWGLAAHLFNLGDVPSADQLIVGAATARKLCEVLKVSGQLSAEGIDDTQLGPLVEDKPANYVVVARVDDPRGAQEVWLRRFKDLKADQELWLVTRKSITLVPAWYRHLVKGESVQLGVEMVNTGLGKLPAKYKPYTPRAVATAFLRLARAGDYDEAARLLDLQSVASDQQARRGARLARRLSLILERLHSGGFGHLNNDPSGAPEKDVPDDEEVLLREKLPAGGGSLELRLARYRIKGGQPIWLVAGSSVEAIDGLYDKVGYGLAGDHLPVFFFRVQFAGVQLWQWIGIAFGLVLSLLFGYALSYVARRVLRRLARSTKWEWDDELVVATRGPLILVFFSLGMIISSGFLVLGSGPQGVVVRLAKLLVVLGGGWFLVRIVDVAGVVVHEFFKRREDEMGMAMVPVARKIFKPIMVLVVLIVALQNAGINVAGLLAGLGIGGLALAMAAKTTVENMLGGVTIAFDRPFKVGDFVKIGDLMGNVEEVGLRSTRVRTLDRTLTTIPNGQVADSRIENFAKRDRVRLLLTIGVQYDTSLDQLRLVVDEIKRALLAHPRVWQESFRVRFSGFGDSALEIEVLAYVDTSDFNLFTAVREELYLQVARIVSEAGAEFAFPSRTIYTGKAAEADGKKGKAAARLIEERIAAGEWTLPEVPEGLRARLQASGSADEQAR